MPFRLVAFDGEVVGDQIRLGNAHVRSFEGDDPTEAIEAVKEFLPTSIHVYLFVTDESGLVILDQIETVGW